MHALLTDILAFVAIVARLAFDAASFSPAAYQLAASAKSAQSAAITIAFLAGISEMLGQSVILVVNRVPLYRFIASLLFTGATYLATALAWTLGALAVAPLTGSGSVSPGDVGPLFALISLCFAPRLLGALAIAPYFGVALLNVLELWSMALVIFGLEHSFDLPLGHAMAVGGFGWAASYGLRAFTGHVLGKPLGRLRLLVSGSALDRSPQQLIDDLVETLRKEMRS